MKKFLAIKLSALLLLVCALIPNALTAAEEILSYHSDIRIAADGSMTVTENIRVRAEGVNIQRGIYRDFPTLYSDRLGNRYEVGFDVLGVLRDGNAEPWSTESRSNGVRVYIGNPNVSLTPGEYSYTLSYRTDRQLGFFDDADELYWNVTGTAWAFPILQASAAVYLPSPTPASALAMEGYTGFQGAVGQAYITSLSDGEGRISTTAPLPAQAGLTLVLRWPKGLIAEPSSAQRFGFLLSDNGSLLIALLTFILVNYFLFITWSRAGRDPAAGVIFPHYQPPSGYSPASLRYISRMGYDHQTLTAAVINLAVKGCLTIQKTDKKYSLKRQESTADLAPGEKVLLAQLFKEDSNVELGSSNQALLAQAMKHHRRALKSNYLNIYFSKNSWLMWPSVVGSLLMLALATMFTQMVIVAAAVFVSLVPIHLLYLYLLKAPSRRGRLLMDKLEGFKLYLEVAEEGDLHRAHPPERTPELFERYLPFAFALGVEQAWAEQFAQLFENLADQGVAYHPLWYHGYFHYHEMSNFSSDVGSGFSSAISSAAAPSGSTSGGGGGGSSGGGGGGGGGGGW